jgi:hypothetical protein
MKAAPLNSLLSLSLLLPLVMARVAAAEPFYNPANGHYYDFVGTPASMSWHEARAAAETLVFAGQRGYLATITSQSEQDLLSQRFDVRRDVWIGATDEAVEGEWRWVTGPEGMTDGGRGLLFWRGAQNGVALAYANWAQGEPNNVVTSSSLDEDYAEWNRYRDLRWNDIAASLVTETQISGYFVEFGGLAELPVRQETLIASGSEWMYSDTGANHGTAWRNVEFDDSNWARGSSEFGYGDGDEQTVVRFGIDPGSKHATTYFRIAGEFDAADLASIGGLSARILRDDGAAVYVNGVEVYRDASLRPGALFNDLANYNGAAAVGNEQETAWFAFSIEPALLRAGLNVIAVEVHQHARSSTDLSFDFQLTAEIATVPEPSSLSLGFIGVILFKSAAWRLRMITRLRTPSRKASRGPSANTAN